MPRSIQTLTLGVALGAAAFAGATFINSAEAERRVGVAESGMGFVDVFGVVDQLVMGDEPTAARAEFETQMQGQIEQIQARNAEIQRQVQEGEVAEEQFNELANEFQQNQQTLQNAFQEYQVQMESMVAGQIAEAYKRVYEAARSVSGEKNVGFVFASRPDSELLQTQSITGVAQEILARPLIAPSDSIDLTPAVREKLGLPEPEETGGSVLEGTVPATAQPAGQTGQTEDQQGGGEEPEEEGN